MIQMNNRIQMAMVAWSVLTLGLVAWGVMAGAGTWSIAVLLMLFAGPLGVAYALGGSAILPTVGQMLKNGPKDQQ
jgi:hypothetical protein